MDSDTTITDDTSLILHKADSLEFTLEDVYDELKERFKVQEQELEHLVDLELNNDPVCLKKTSSHSEITKKQQRFVQILSKLITVEDIRDLQFAHTSDLCAQMTTELKDEVRDMQEILQATEHQLKDVEADITYMENSKACLQRMKELRLEAKETVVSKTYEKEAILVNRMFKSVKDDLHQVVAQLYPGNNRVRDLLSDLCTAYFKGGDDIYIDINPEALECANFLLETGLVIQHRNDKNKIRLADML